MVESGEQIEGDYPGMLNSSFFAESFSLLDEHCAAVKAPVVLISGTYRADQLNMLQLLSVTRGLTLREVPAHVTEGSLLERRVALLPKEANPQESADLLEEFCLEYKQPGSALLIPWVDLLDQDSKGAIDIVLRRAKVPVFMTSLGEPGLGFPFSWVLQSERGFKANLSPLSDDESHQLLCGILDEPPTKALTEYLSRCTGYGARALADTARQGLTEGWIHVVRNRSIIARIPSWLNRNSARHFCLRIRQELGAPMLTMLQLIAAEGQVELDELTDDSRESDTLFALVGAGLLSISGTRLSIRRPCDQRDLLLGPQEIDTRDVATPYAALSVRASGREISPTTAASEASALLEQGLLDQARFVVQSGISPHAFAGLVEACADVAAGAPFRALTRLASPVQVEGGQSFNGSEESESAASLNIIDEQRNDLYAFISGVLLQQPVSEKMRRSRFGPLLDVLAGLRNVDGPENLAKVDAEGLGERRRSYPTDSLVLVNTEFLAQAAEMALRAYLFSLQDNHEAAVKTLRQFDALPLSQLPLVGLSWVLEVVGRARMLAVLGKGALSQRWFQGESPERKLVRLLISDSLRWHQGLICGEPDDVLRVQLEDLWSQFEGGLAPAGMSRQLLEAFDYTIEGDRSEDLIGPVSLSSPRMIGPFWDPWVNVVVAIGRMLHCPVEALESDIEGRLSGWLSLPAVRRMILRAVLLRRGPNMSAPALEELVRCAEEVGVEPAVIGLARAMAVSDENAITEARNLLHSKYPDYIAAQRAPQKVEHLHHPQLRADRMQLLSPREQEVVQRLISGDTEVQAAEALGGISVRTVQTHVRNIYRKLEVNTRTELRAGLMESAGLR